MRIRTGLYFALLRLFFTLTWIVWTVTSWAPRAPVRAPVALSRVPACAAPA